MSAAADDRPVESCDPATGEVWRTYTAATREEVFAAAALARQASRGWAATPVRQRAQLLRRFREAAYARRDDIAETLVRENGKPRAEAFFEILAALDFARYYARVAPRALRTETLRSSSLAFWRKSIRIEREPFGVVGIITPWNYPFLLMSGIAIPALVAGNALLIKPSEYTPTSGVLFGDLLREAGVPAGLVSVLPGAQATGAALVDAPIDKIFFTGSAATGRKVAVRAAERMIPCTLELGGSDAAIVLADADARTAAVGISWGRFSNGGQTCVAPKRVFVVDAIYDDFVREIGAAVGRLGADLPPLIRPAQQAIVDAQYRDAIARGARAVATGMGGGVGAVLLTDVTDAMRVLREETFGPLLPIVRVRDEEEAVARANATEYGLGASVWSRDPGHARAIAARLECGTVTINDSVIVAALPDAPYGGVKSSGSGRAHGIAGLLECTRTKTIVTDPWGSWRESYWHPYSSEMTRGLESFTTMAHGRGILRRIGAAVRALRLLYVSRR